MRRRSPQSGQLWRSSDSPTLSETEMRPGSRPRIAFRFEIRVAHAKVQRESS
jgi:hypothetical protein